MFIKYLTNLFATIDQLSATSYPGHFLSLHDWSTAPRPKVIGAFNRKFINFPCSVGLSDPARVFHCSNYINLYQL